MVIKKILFTILVLLSTIVFSQNDSISSIDKINYNDKISVKLFALNTSNQFVFSNKGDNQTYLFKPNERTHFGLAVHFRSISFSFSITPEIGFINKFDDDSKLINFGINKLFGNHWLQSLDLYYEKGFSAKNNIFDLYFPKLKTIKVTGSTGYVFNTDFLLYNGGFFNQWQSKNAGSFIPKFHYGYTKYKLQSSGFDDDSNSYDFYLAPGYQYNWIVADHFILSGSASVGFGLNHTDYADSNITSAIYSGDITGLIGYNSTRIYTGIKSSFLLVDHHFDRATRVDDEIKYFEFFFGYRFDSPKKILHFADKHKL